MITCTVGPEQGKDYLSKKGYPCKADRSIDSVKAEVLTLCSTIIYLLTNNLMEGHALTFT